MTAPKARVVQSPGAVASFTITYGWSAAATDKVGLLVQFYSTSATPPTMTTVPSGMTIVATQTQGIGSGFHLHGWLLRNTVDADTIGGSVAFDATAAATAVVGVLYPDTDTAGVQNGTLAMAGQATGTTTQSTHSGVTVDDDGSTVVSAASANGAPTVQSVTGHTAYLTETSDLSTWWRDADAGATGSITSTRSSSVAGMLATWVMTPPAAPAVPSEPQSLSATAGDTEVDLSWSAPADDGGSVVTGYVVEARNRNGGTWATIATPTGTTHTATGLTNYDVWQFRVSATNANGTGPSSTVAEATPTDGDDPDDAFNLGAGALGDLAALSADWGDVGDATLGQLQAVDDHVESDFDPQGTGAIWQTAVGPDCFVEVDVILGADGYSELVLFTRLDAADAGPEDIVFGQYVNQGDWAAQGSIVGPALQIWEEAGGAFTLLAESALADIGERTLRFEVQGETMRFVEGVTTLLEHTEAGLKTTGDYIGIGATAIDGATDSLQIDNLRVGALASSVRKLRVGSDLVERLYVGTQQVDRVYVGTDIVFDG